jgi:hypothetical protein
MLVCIMQRKLFLFIFLYLNFFVWGIYSIQALPQYLLFF